MKLLTLVIDVPVGADTSRIEELHKRLKGNKLTITIGGADGGKFVLDSITFRMVSMIGDASIICTLGIPGLDSPGILKSVSESINRELAGFTMDKPTVWHAFKIPG